MRRSRSWLVLVSLLTFVFGSCSKDSHGERISESEQALRSLVIARFLVHPGQHDLLQLKGIENSCSHYFASFDSDGEKSLIFQIDEDGLPSLVMVPYSMIRIVKDEFKNIPTVVLVFPKGKDIVLPSDSKGILETSIYVLISRRDYLAANQSVPGCLPDPKSSRL